MGRLGLSWIVIIIMLLLDLYVFQAIRMLSQPAPQKLRWMIFGVFWILSALSVITISIILYSNFENWLKPLRTYLLASIIGLFLSKMITATFLMVDDLRRVIQWAGGKLYYQFLQQEPFTSSGISRSAFLSWIGLAAGGGIMGSLLYGFGNKYRYRVKRVKLSFDNLPIAFRGLRILHFSDIHSGSFTDKRAVEHGVEMILAQKADLILFTGDLVNDHADEMKEYKEIFSRISAPMGVYSTLGNHDYGDYRKWSSAEEKRRNLQNLKDIHHSMGWRLLMNEHVPLERGEDRIGLLGIENWSAKANFSKYGKMKEAYAGAEQYPFKILMSHDPSHWDAEVRPSYGDVDLTLSGHTHGMQFGLEFPGFKWSPVQYVYKQWAGLYEKGKQKLYVNRGFGFIGYPGRVGILPEITVLELS